MKRAWIGMALLSGSWLFGLGYYHQANWLVWVVLVAGGALLLTGADVPTPRRLAAVCAIALLIPAVLVAGWPHRLAPLLIAVGIALAAAPIPRRWARPVGRGLTAAGIVLLAQALAMPAYECFTARVPDLPSPLPQALAWVVQRMGMDVAVDGATVTVFSMREPHRLAATWGLLVDPASLCFLVGAIVLIALRSAGRAAGRGRSLWAAVRDAGMLAVAIVLWLPLRAGLLIALYMHRVLRTDYDAPLILADQFWNRWIQLAAMIVPVLLAWRIVRAAQSTGEPPAEPPGRARWKPFLAPAACCLAVALLTAAALWDGPATRKGGRVLFDDFHSGAPWRGKHFDTTRTDKPFDTTWYGHESTYNFACIYEYCSRFYETSRLAKKPVDEAALKNCDVLVLKVPSREFSPDEIDAVRRFVDRGGGLLLIGEHTTVFGSGRNLNQIAQTYGFRFRYDCLFGIDSVFRQRYSAPLVPHPIVQHMPPMNFAVSCSIDPGLSGGRAVIRSTGLKDLSAYYHVGNYYPPTDDRPEMRYGAFVQLWATRDGAGRVAAFTDSTIFANFSALEPGNPQLMLGMLEWLNHRDAWDFPARGYLGIAGLVLLIAAAIVSRFWGGGGLVLLAAGVLGWSLSAVAVRAAHRAAMPAAQQVRPMVRVAMDRTVSGGELPTGGFISGKDNEFGLFEQNILRLGYFPFRLAAPDVFDCDAIVLLHPNKTVTSKFRRRLVEYVHAGGKVLVLDSPQNTSSTANSLLHPFGLTVDRSVSLSGDLLMPPGWPSAPVAAALEIRGGVPLANIGGRPVAAFVRQGKGSVTAIGFGSRFTDANMGVTDDIIPDAKLRRVFGVEYALLRAMLIDERPSATQPAASQPAATQPSEGLDPPPPGADPHHIPSREKGSGALHHKKTPDPVSLRPLFSRKEKRAKRG